MSYEGRCHCGAVSFSVAGDVPGEAISCNCSHCAAKGLLLAFVPGDAFTLTAGEALLQTYLFNTGKIEHRFCTTCGTEPFACGTGPDGTAMRAINLRCVPAVDPDALTLRKVDGAAR